MAFLQVTFFSQTLGMNMDMDVLLPENPTSTPLKTVYLLHGMSDNQTNWQRYSAVERHIFGKNVAIVMPTTHLAWYTDMECGYLRYFTFVSEEVPAVCRRMFPQLSSKREDNFIAGLSMGGYGALKIALSHSDAFEKVACYSAAFKYVTLDYTPYWNSVFGDTPEKREKHRIETYIDNNIAGNNRKPPIYMWCGTEDGLLQSNRDTRDLLISKGFDVTYSESEGGHEWRCWDEQFRRSLDFFGI